MKYQGKSGKSILSVDRKIHLNPTSCTRTLWTAMSLLGWRTANNGELIWAFHCRGAEVPPRCMNTGCCWLPLIIWVCADITGSRILGARAAWAREGESTSQQGTKTQGVSPKSTHTAKASSWVRFIAQRHPVHLAADGCSILDLAIPLEKTSSVIVFSVLFSICS